ncbi:MAG TPA: CpsD/CapB family tyrosine-protein kinase [Vicinamibacterales bacterium]|jgi:capsular exopolysaccharide synthesis family protein|nr:CpsD/CapB family tyrosine-protein kinase [Vicinamibacterales bacterium]
MSRIQSILDKAEREGAVLRTGHFDAPAPLAATVPITIDIDKPAAESRPDRSIVPGPSTAGHSTVSSSSAMLPSTEAMASHFVRLSPLLVAGLAPKSAAAEQYRQLRTRLSHTEGMNNLRTVLVTSPQKGEGKSLTSANLALTMAQELHRKVVLVEADLRKPSMLQLFGLPPGPGLTEYLSGAADAMDVMRFLPDHNLTVIPAGSAATNPAELLGSTAMRRLLDALRTRFDRVILDTPPVLPLADVAVLAPLVDGSLMVVRAGVTPKPAIENALRAFDSSRMLGIVLNDSGLEHDYRYEATRH